jgi:hypothetical protein
MRYPAHGAAELVAEGVRSVKASEMSKEVAPIKTHVVIKYRAPGSDPDQDDEIRTEAIPYEPETALSLIHAEGQTFSLLSDYPDKYGDQPKEYKVVERYIEPGIKNRLNVIVSDPDSTQAPPGSPETAAESEGRGEGETPPDTEHRPWWQRFFFGP